MAASRVKTNRKSVKKYGRNTRKNATSHKKKQQSGTSSSQNRDEQQ